jgi:hypothetical protein
MQMRGTGGGLKSPFLEPGQKGLSNEAREESASGGVLR